MLIIPDSVQSILRNLEERGYEGFVVGGAVRDFLMGEKPHDWDIATNAQPEQVKELFPKVLDTGIKHGTVTAMVGGEGYEITTYRVDGDYSDGRHPDDVVFVDSIEKDLSRRDFTINAMAMDVRGNIVDPFGGKEDIEKGIVRCVGDPDDRFSEDALRMIRAVRFESKFGFCLDKNTKDAITRNADKLSSVSMERVRDEFTKMLMTDHPRVGFKDAYETGITAKVFPEFDAIMECEQNTPYHFTNVGEHSLIGVEACPKDEILRWSMLLHDMGKPDSKSSKNGRDTFYNHAEKSAEIADDVLTRFRFSTKDKNKAVSLVKYHGLVMSKSNKIRRFAAKHGETFLNDLYTIKKADAKASNPDYYDAIMREHTPFIEKAIGYIHDGTAIKPSDLNINGNELKEYGIEGKSIGAFMRSAYDECLTRPELNTNDFLRQRAQKLSDRMNIKKNLDEAQEMAEQKGLVTGKEDDEPVFDI